MKATLSLPTGVALSIVLCATLAHAQLDDGIDGLGVYFDTSATQVSVDGVVGDPIAIVDAYLVLVKPSLEGQIDYWECAVVANSEDFWGAWGEPTHGINTLTNIPGSYFGFIVYVSEIEPFFTQPITILAHLHFGSESPEYGAQIYVLSQDSGYSVVGSDLQGFNPSSGSWDLHVASINSTPPVATNRLTFGAIKSLFSN
jgi:hypothetical protein